MRMRAMNVESKPTTRRYTPEQKEQALDERSECHGDRNDDRDDGDQQSNSASPGRVLRQIGRPEVMLGAREGSVDDLELA
jgi:hypothetical protein